jgi:hypothetical protein
MNPVALLLALRALSAVMLYAFLATLLVFLWRDYRLARREHALPPAHLVVRAGLQPGCTYQLGEVNLLGRARDNTVLLADTTVSSYHARLSFQSGQWWLEDLGSRNGTRLNGLPLEAPLVITYGDEIELGSVRLAVVAGLVEDAGPARG